MLLFNPSAQVDFRNWRVILLLFNPSARGALFLLPLARNPSFDYAPLAHREVYPEFTEGLRMLSCAGGYSSQV